MLKTYSHLYFAARKWLPLSKHVSSSEEESRGGHTMRVKMEQMRSVSTKETGPRLNNNNKNNRTWASQQDDGPTSCTSMYRMETHTYLDINLTHAHMTVTDNDHRLSSTKKEKVLYEFYTLMNYMKVSKSRQFSFLDQLSFYHCFFQTSRLKKHP